MGTPLTTRRRAAETAVQRAPTMLSGSRMVAVECGAVVTDVTMSACRSLRRAEPTLICVSNPLTS